MYVYESYKYTYIIVYIRMTLGMLLNKINYKKKTSKVNEIIYLLFYFQKCT